MAMHDVCVQRHQSAAVAFLCLLCQRRLLDDECHAHVFSLEHVVSFLVSVCFFFPSPSIHTPLACLK